MTRESWVTELREKTLLQWPHTKTHMVLLFCAELRIKLRRGEATEDRGTLGFAFII